MLADDIVRSRCQPPLAESSEELKQFAFATLFAKLRALYSLLAMALISSYIVLVGRDRTII